MKPLVLLLALAAMCAIAIDTVSASSRDLQGERY